MSVATLTRRLEEGGFTQEQAMAVADVMHEEMIENAATKTDVDSVRADVGLVKADLDSVKADLGLVKGDLGLVKADLTHLGQRFGRLESDLDRVRSELREYIHVVVGEASARMEKTIHQESKSTVKWVAGIIVVQTVALLTSVIGLVKFLT